MINQQNPLFSIDFYKVGHKDMAPVGTEFVYINLTPRFDQHANVLRQFYDNKVVVFGIQAYLMRLNDRWHQHFFSRPMNEAVGEYKEVIDASLFTNLDVSHLEALHCLGYLPIEVRALEEGSLCPIGVPVLTVHNTLPEFHWLPTYLETDLSAGLWQAITNATVARNFRMILEHFHTETGTDRSFIPWQGHDFSARGLSNPESALMTGMAHLTSFLGTDTVVAVPGAVKYYSANQETSFVGHSVPATEHSVTCMGGEQDERETYKRWMQTYPTGILSNVMDTWDYWNAINVILPSLKDEIMARDGKYVIRPDSGDPVKIVTGYNVDEIEWDEYDNPCLDGKPFTTVVYKGSVEVLAEHFGTTTNMSGYLTLDPHVGLIYGDSITPQRAYDILDRLKNKEFAADNIVFGVGSYTYQYNTRDTFGFAVKATYCVVDGVGRNIQKAPKTGDGKKKSATGILKVVQDGDTMILEDSQDVNVKDVVMGNFDSGLLTTVYRNGYITRHTTLSHIRKKLWNWDDSK